MARSFVKKSVASCQFLVKLRATFCGKAVIVPDGQKNRQYLSIENTELARRFAFVSIPEISEV